MVLDYIKIIRRDHFSFPQTSENDDDNGLKINTLDIDPTGFPLAPRPHSWAKVLKVELEPIYRLYITRSYRKSYWISIFISVTSPSIQSWHAKMIIGRLPSKGLPRTLRTSLTRNTFLPAFRLRTLGR
jgi:hypothetical protein